MCGGVYLGWLAWKLLRSAVAGGSGAEVEGRAEVLTPRGAFVQGLVTNLLNPKAVIFLASVLAAMLGPEPSVVRKAGFWLIVVGQALVFWSLFVWLLQRPAVQRAYLGSERLWHGGFGLASRGLVLGGRWAGGGGACGETRGFFRRCLALRGRCRRRWRRGFRACSGSRSGRCGGSRGSIRRGGG